MTPPCARRWEVEAARDGRLVGAALEQHHAHLARCESCRAEAEALDALSAALRPRSPDEVSLRRLRNRVLSQADAQVAGKPRVGPARRVLLVALAASLLAVWAVVGLRAAPEATGASPSTPATRVEVHATPQAIWSENVEDGVHHVRLAAGTLHLTVHRAAGGGRVLVHVPDGEIEEQGTVFSVSVSQHRTVALSVIEGRIVYRRVDGTRIALDGGHSWTRPASPIPPALSSPAAAPTPSLSSAGNPVRAMRAVPPPSAGDDGQAEDAVYLHVLALLNEGRDAEARLAAHEYLRRFPHGFRQREVRAIAER